MAATQTTETNSLPTGAASPLPPPDQKHEFVREMFDTIAPRYDLLNSVLSARLHHGWRRVAADYAALEPGDNALDVCTGTGDLAFELARRVGPTGFVTATDFSPGMLELGEAKGVAQNKRDASVQFMLADTQHLPFVAGSFDAVTVGFGIRNVADVAGGIQEMARVAKPGGRVVILEFSQPQNSVVAALYGWYSFRVLPLVGGLISGRRGAYEYLPSSVKAFYTRAEITDIMEEAGLANVRVSDLAFGTVAVHCGTKTAVSPAPVGE